MASGDFLDLAQRAAYLAQRDITLAADLTRAKEAINEAYLHICDGSVQYDFLTKTGTQAMTISQEAYTYTTIGTSLSVTVREVIGLSSTATGTNIGDTPDMHYLSWDDYWGVKSLAQSLTTDVPVVWTIVENNQILVWPKPSTTTALQVLALQMPVEMAVDAATPLVPLQWRHRVLVPYAAYLLLRQEGGEEADAAAMRFYADYQAAQEQMRAAHELPGPLRLPTPAKTVLPRLLRPSTGSLADLAVRTCYATGMKPWDANAVVRAKEALIECYTMMMDNGTNWDFLQAETTFNTVGAQSNYAFTAINANCNEPLTLTNATTNQVLSYLEYTDFRRLTQMGGALTGTPEVWTKFADTTVILYPTPSGVQSIRALYQRTGGTFVSDTDVTLFPYSAWAHRVLVPCAAIRLMEQNGAPADGDLERLRADYQEAYAQLVKSHGTEQEMLGEPTDKFLLPTAMRGTSGSFLALAQEACRAAGGKQWNQYDMNRAKQFINEAYMYICEAGPTWRFLEGEGTFTTVANADIYTTTALATALSVTGAITDVSMLVNDTRGGIPLKNLDWQSLERISYDSQDDTASEPKYWTEFDGKVRLWPKPDQVYTMGIYYKFRPAEMSLDSDTPLIPLTWRSRLLVPYAAAKMLREFATRDTNSIGFADRRASEFEAAFAQFSGQYGAARHPRLGLDDASWDRNWPGSPDFDFWLTMD